MHETQGQRRQDEILQGAPEGGPVEGEKCIDGIETGQGIGRRNAAPDASGARQPAELAIEDEDEQQAQPERWSRNSGDRDGAGDLIEPAVSVDGGENAERDAGDDGEAEGREYPAPRLEGA